MCKCHGDFRFVDGAGMGDFMKYRLKEMLYTFSSTVTGVLFAAALFITIFSGRDAMVPVQLLWQILITSVVCMLGNLLRACEAIARRRRLSHILHYLYINAAVFGCGRVFDWYKVENMKHNAFLFLMIALIYAGVSYSVWLKNKKTSELLNQHLEKYQDKKAGCMSNDMSCDMSSEE